MCLWTEKKPTLTTFSAAAANLSLRCNWDIIVYEPWDNEQNELYFHSYQILHTGNVSITSIRWIIIFPYILLVGITQYYELVINIWIDETNIKRLVEIIISCYTSSKKSFLLCNGNKYIDSNFQSRSKQIRWCNRER